MPDVRELGRKVKAKYPGKYDDLADEDVGRKVKAKFPGAYDDFTDTPAQQPEGVFSSFQTGVAGPLLRNVVETAADLYNAPGETLERAGRGALEFVSAFDPAGAAYEPTVKDQAARVAELNRRADERLPEPIKSMKAGMAIEEAKPRTRAGRVAGVAGSILGEVAFPTAPENVAGNIITAPFGGAATKSAGVVFKSGVNAVRRVFGKGAAQIIEAEALPAATAQIRQSIGEAVPVAGEAAPVPAATASTAATSTAGQASPTVQRAMSRFQEEVQRINASNLTPKQKAAELDAAIAAISREARGAPDTFPTRESMVQSRYPRQKNAPPMIMPENPNPIQQAGRLPGEPEFNPPPLEADLGQPSFGVSRAPEPAFTETSGPSLSESLGMSAPSARVAGPSASAPLDMAISEAAQSVPKPVAQRILSNIAAIYHLPRTLLSSLDLSAPFRQGALLTIPPSQWGRAGRAGVRMFQALKTKNYEQIAEAIATHADAPVANDAGLYLATKAEAGLQGAEEAFLSKYAGKIPLVKQSEQAYKTYLDSLRMDTFSKYKNVIDKSGLTAEQAQSAYKAAATWINYATGRGSLGQTIDKAMPALSTVIFSPRFVASRLNVLNPVYYAKNAATPAGRAVLKQQMGELVQYAGVVAGTMALAKAAGADVSLNPNSPDFLKIKAGRWRYDTLAGLQQVMRLIYRSGADIQNKIRGEKTEGPNALEISGNFLRSKLAPAPSAFVDFIKGRTVTGKPFSAGETAVKLVAPIQWADFVEAYQKEGFGGVAKSSPGFFGFGVQQYDSPPVQAAIDKTQPLFSELQRLNKRVSELRRKDGEKDDAFNTRVQQFGQNYTQFGMQLINSPRFQAAPDNIKGLALESLNARAKALTSREDAFPALTLDANTIMDAAENSKKNPARK